MSDSDIHIDPEDEPPSSIIDRQDARVFPSLEIDIDIVDTSLGGLDLLAPQLTRIVSAVLQQQAVANSVCAEIFVRVVDSDDSQQLNGQFRGKDYATNVLSFPGTEPDDLTSAIMTSAAGGPPVMLGDIIIAAPVVTTEATAQGKPILDHFFHLVTHGLLHLLGHDHIEDTQAEKMEAIEIVILADLGIANPYAAPPYSSGQKP